MHEHDPVGLGPAHRLLEEVEIRSRGRRVMRVAKKEHLGHLEHVAVDALEIRQVVMLRGCGDAVEDPARHNDPVEMDWIGGVGHQRDVVVIQEGEREMRDAFLGADERQDLAARVERHAKLPEVPLGDRLPELALDVAVRPGIAVVGRILDLPAQVLHHMLGRRQVRVAHSQVDDVDAALAGLSLEIIEDREQIQRQPLEATGLLKEPLLVALGLQSLALLQVLLDAFQNRMRGHKASGSSHGTPPQSQPVSRAWPTGRQSHDRSYAQRARRTPTENRRRRPVARTARTAQD